MKLLQQVQVGACVLNHLGLSRPHMNRSLTFYVQSSVMMQHASQ